MSITRCDWATHHPLEEQYHDHEWGNPLFDDQKLFEFIILEGAQAGLNWLTILKKRDGYRQQFFNFDAKKIANMTDADIEACLQNPNIIRNQKKVLSTRQNALAYLKIIDSGQTFSDFIWQFVDGKPIINHWKTMADVPAQTDISNTMSKTLKKHGFNFVGPTICYAFMQATGMVNDHLVNCFRHQKCM